MTKQDLIQIFGTQAAAGRALGVSRQMIHQLPIMLPQNYQDRAIGACVRLGIPVPAHVLVKKFGATKAPESAS